MKIHFSENAANVSSFLSASSMAAISSSRQVFFKGKIESIYFKEEFIVILPIENRTKMPDERSINVPWYLLKQYKHLFKGKIYLQGPFKHDSAKTSAARTSTCLSVNRLSVVDVIRFFERKTNDQNKNPSNFILLLFQ